MQERDFSRRREQRLGFAIQKRERDNFTAGRPLSTQVPNTIDRPSGSQSGQFTVFGSARNNSSLVPVANLNRRIALPPSASVE